MKVIKLFVAALAFSLSTFAFADDPANTDPSAASSQTQAGDNSQGQASSDQQGQQDQASGSSSSQASQGSQTTSTDE